LPKLIYFFFLKITNGDFRSGMVLNVLLIGLLTAILIKAFNHIRGGKTNYTDAFFPIAFLHIGNWPNLFWSWQIGFVLPTLITCVLIVIVIQYTNLLNLRLAIIASICLVSLPLCGANGIIYLLSVLPWLAYEGFLHLRSKEAGANRKVGLLLFTAIGLTLLIVGAYFIGYVRPYWNPPSPNLTATLKTGAKFMAMAFGPGVSLSWKISVAIVLVLVIATTILLLLAALKLKSREFQRAMGLLFFMGASLIFALAMGWGRAALVPTLGLPIRYVMLAIPILLICYSSWELYGLPVLRNMINWGLFLSMLVLLFTNIHEGLIWRNYYVHGADAVIQDIKLGVPQSELVERHQQFLLHWDKQLLSTSMQQLKDAGIGPFKHMKVDIHHNNTSAAKN
jgi:heme/copper-type cytochrome/quinol oxidase subunit 4